MFLKIQPSLTKSVEEIFYKITEKYKINHKNRHDSREACSNIVKSLNLPIQEYKEESKMLLLDIYVYDGIASGTQKEVQRGTQQELRKIQL